MNEIESMRVNLVEGMNDDKAGWQNMEKEVLRKAWAELQTSAKHKWRWSIGSLASSIGNHGSAPVYDDEEEDEEGEYAPMVVEL